jgi:hypothetical protein
MLRNQDPSPYKEIDIKGMEKELERKWNWKRNGYGAHKKTNMVSQLDNVSWKWNGYGVYKKNQYGLTAGQCELPARGNGTENNNGTETKPIGSHSWTM